MMRPRVITRNKPAVRRFRLLAWLTAALTALSVTAAIPLSKAGGTGKLFGRLKAVNP